MPRKLKPCGTPAACRRHRAHKEPTCAACCAAITLANRKYRPEPAKRRGESKCGTPGGYQKHKRRREDACDACLAAAAEKQRKYRASRKASLEAAS